MGFMLALVGSFLNCLQGLVFSKIQIFVSQKSMELNPTFLQNAKKSDKIKHSPAPCEGIAIFHHNLLVRNDFLKNIHTYSAVHKTYIILITNDTFFYAKTILSKTNILITNDD